MTVSTTLAIQISYINIVPLHVYIVAYCIQFWICNIANIHTTYIVACVPDFEIMIGGFYYVPK